LCTPFVSDGGLMMKKHAKDPNAYPTLIKSMGLAVLLLCLSTGAWAQLRIVGAISGTVQDQTGAVIPGVQVRLTDIKTGIMRETISTENGTFFFPDLASGLYEVIVTAPGFQTARLENISVSTSQTADVRVTMQVGQASAEVTVSAETTQVLETSSQL